MGRRRAKNNLKSNCVMPHGCKGVQRDIFSFLMSFSTVLPLHINFQPVPFSFLGAFIEKVTSKTNGKKNKKTTPPPKQSHWV